METREIIQSLVKTQPGLSTRGIARALGVNDSTADYHLRRLKREGRLACVPEGRELRWYLAGCGLCPVLRRAMPEFRRPEMRRVALALSETPTSVTRLAQRSGVPEGSVRWLAGVLHGLGLAEKSRSGRLSLAEGAEACIVKAAAGERCEEWGKCRMSRRLEGAAAPVALRTSGR